MPPKSIQTSQTNVSDRLELAKSISNMTSKADAFIASVEHYKVFSKEVLTKLDLDIETKKVELEELNQQIAQQTKNAKIDIELNLKEFKRESAIKILKESDEICLSQTVYDNLTNELRELKANLNETIDKVKKEESEKAKSAVASATKNLELSSKAQNAVLNASNEQKDREILSLKATIDDLRNEVKAQRELTKAVAASGHGQQWSTGSYQQAQQQQRQ